MKANRPNQDLFIRMPKKKCRLPALALIGNLVWQILLKNLPGEGGEVEIREVMTELLSIQRGGTGINYQEKEDR